MRTFFKCFQYNITHNITARRHLFLFTRFLKKIINIFIEILLNKKLFVNK